MKEYYEQRLSEFGSELKRYQQMNGESGAADLVTRSQQDLLLDKMKWVEGEENKSFRD